MLKGFACEQGGRAEAAGMFMFPSSSTGTVTGASFSTNFVPKGTGLLTKLFFEQNWLIAKGTTENICLTGADFSSDTDVLTVSTPTCGEPPGSVVAPNSVSAGRISLDQLSAVGA